jgi:ATP-dependent Zn protease
MAARHLRDLIAAYGEQDDLKFRRAAQAIIHEEESKRHTVVAKELRQLLAGSGSIAINDTPALPQPPVDRDSSLPLAQVSHPTSYLSDLVLADRPQHALAGLLNEVRHWSKLDASGLPRRNRVMLYGPPGCGKTSAVGALSKELGWPLVTARVEGLMSSYLGETAANLRNLFDFVATGPFVLFLDEFDSLGKMRDDPSDHGELRRVVNAVLQQIDAYAGPSIVVAATNHPQVLDTALWRRFDLIVELPLPSVEELATVLRRMLIWGPKQSVASAAEALGGLPHAAAEYAANSARRAAVLDGRAVATEADLAAAVEDARSRPWA